MDASDLLMARIANGDSDAFSDLFNEWNLNLKRFIYKCTSHRGRRSSCSDVAQEVWIHVHQFASDYLPRGNFKGWLFRIAINVSIDLFRRDRRRQSVQWEWGDQLVEHYMIATGDTVERAIGAEEIARVEKILPSIPDDQAAVFSLFVFGGLSLPEIAEKMSESLPTTKSRFRLAKEKIRLALGVVKPSESPDEILDSISRMFGVTGVKGQSVV